MGEYAIRNSDNEHVKIGTCNTMFGIRYEDRHKVSDHDYVGIEANLRFRLPYPNEDKIKIGEYESFDKDYPLKGYLPNHPEDLTSDTLRFPYSYIINKCYHGNYYLSNIGHVPRDSVLFRLTSVKNTIDGIQAVVKCCSCEKQWAVNMCEVLPYVKNVELKRRLEAYALGTPDHTV